MLLLIPVLLCFYSIGGSNGLIVITTRQGGMDLKDINSTGVLPISPIGFYKAREFYAPIYKHKNDPVSVKDLRLTICWKPEIQTDKDGNASFDYYNVDDTRNYRVVIEGIDDEGN